MREVKEEDKKWWRSFEGTGGVEEVVVGWRDVKEVGDMVLEKRKMVEGKKRLGRRVFLLFFPTCLRGENRVFGRGRK